MEGRLENWGGIRAKINPRLPPAKCFRCSCGGRVALLTGV
jgi:hypothetical protein